MSPLAPYCTPHEHLADLLQLHDLRLKRLVARRHKRKPADLLGFAAIGASEVQQLLDAQPPENEPLVDGIEQLQLHIDARVEQSSLQNIRLPILELAKHFTLTPREIGLLLPALAVELDSRYERIYGFLHDDMSRRLASPGLALSLSCDDFDGQLKARALLSPQAPLRHYRLLELADEGAPVPWQSRALRIDERIVSFLIGDLSYDGRIEHLLGQLDDDSSESQDLEESLVRLVRWSGSSGENRKPLIYMHGAAHGGADGLVSGVATQVGVPVITVDCERLAAPGSDFEQALFLLFREALLSEASLYFRNLDRLLEPPTALARHRTLMRCLQDMGRVVFASGDSPWSWPLPAEPVVLRTLELQRDGFPEQLQVWQVLSNGAFAETELHRLVSLHPLPVSAIGDVWRVAQGLAAASDGASTPTLEQLREACRTYAGAPLSSLARRIMPSHHWEDLVLPAGQLEQLRALCSQARHSSIVYGAWCFERKLSLGRGLNALFCGPPGTGKTMAAEVIASELGVELLKIDLSQIVSKYIGETEKNLRQLFDQAATANAILFFDEADALLGKRSDVKDAHDRYANTETAYLLQKMEEYPGIAILATNLRQNLDMAFTRRMRFIIDFPFPEEEDRLRIWQSVWPAQVPLAADVDMPTLARQFRLSGGSIRNVALSAAFLAAEQGQPVGMQHLMRATRRELQKMGRLVTEDDTRRHGTGGT